MFCKRVINCVDITDNYGQNVNVNSVKDSVAFSHYCVCFSTFGGMFLSQ